MRKDTKAKEDGQQTLFDAQEFQEWKTEWVGMPAFQQDDATAYRTIYVHFKNEEDVKAFEKLVGQKIIRYAGGPGSMWYPKAEIGKMAGRLYVSDEQDEP